MVQSAWKFVAIIIIHMNEQDNPKNNKTIFLRMTKILEA